MTESDVEPGTGPEAEPDWAALPPLRDVIAASGLHADKKLGQNFLLDLNITDKIVAQSGDVRGAHIVEIGPGPGGLTRSLLRAGAASVTAIEFDPRAVAALQPLVSLAAGRLTLIEADALKADVAALSPRRRPVMVYGNLPYNIASPLLLGWLALMERDPGIIAAMTLMFQREVGDRLTAPPGGGDYGRLSVMAQWICHVSRLFDLPPSVFTPPPKVTSSVVHFSPRKRVESPRQRPDFKTMEKIVGAAFGQRRKMLRSSLRPYEDALARSGIDPALRAEQLSVADFERIAVNL